MGLHLITTDLGGPRSAGSVGQTFAQKVLPPYLVRRERRQAGVSAIAGNMLRALDEGAPQRGSFAAISCT